MLIEKIVERNVQCGSGVEGDGILASCCQVELGISILESTIRFLLWPCYDSLRSFMGMRPCFLFRNAKYDLASSLTAVADKRLTLQTIELSVGISRENRGVLLEEERIKEVFIWWKCSAIQQDVWWSMSKHCAHYVQVLADQLHPIWNIISLNQAYSGNCSSLSNIYEYSLKLWGWMTMWKSTLKHVYIQLPHSTTKVCLSVTQEDLSNTMVRNDTHFHRRLFFNILRYFPGGLGQNPCKTWVSLLGTCTLPCGLGHVLPEARFLKNTDTAPRALKPNDLDLYIHFNVIWIEISRRDASDDDFRAYPNLSMWSNACSRKVGFSIRLFMTIHQTRLISI